MSAGDYIYDYVRLREPPIRLGAFEDLLAACGVNGILFAPEGADDEVWGWPPTDAELLTSGYIRVPANHDQKRTRFVTDVVHEALHLLAGESSDVEEAGMLALKRVLASAVTDAEDRMDALCRYGSFADLDLGDLGSPVCMYRVGIPSVWDTDDWKWCVAHAQETGLFSKSGTLNPELLQRMVESHACRRGPQHPGFQVLNADACVVGP